MLVLLLLEVRVRIRLDMLLLSRDVLRLSDHVAIYGTWLVLLLIVLPSGVWIIALGI